MGGNRQEIGIALIGGSIQPSLCPRCHKSRLQKRAHIPHCLLQRSQIALGYAFPDVHCPVTQKIRSAARRHFHLNAPAVLFRIPGVSRRSDSYMIRHALPVISGSQLLHCGRRIVQYNKYLLLLHHVCRRDRFSLQKAKPAFQFCQEQEGPILPSA